MHPFSYSQQPAFDSQIMFGDSQCTQNTLPPPASLLQQHSQQPQQQPPRWPGRYLKKRPPQGLGECNDNEADWQAHRRPHLLCLAALSSLNPRVDITFEVDPAAVPKKRVHQVGFPLFLNDVSILRYVRHPSARLLFDSRDLHRSGEEEEGGGRGGGGGEGGEGEGGGGGGGGERGSLVAFDFTDGEDALRACLLLVQIARPGLSIQEGLPFPLPLAPSAALLMPPPLSSSQLPPPLPTLSLPTPRSPSPSLLAPPLPLPAPSSAKTQAPMKTPPPFPRPPPLPPNSFSSLANQTLAKGRAAMPAFLSFPSVTAATAATAAAAGAIMDEEGGDGGEGGVAAAAATAPAPAPAPATAIAPLPKQKRRKPNAVATAAACLVTGATAPVTAARTPTAAALAALAAPAKEGAQKGKGGGKPPAAAAAAATAAATSAAVANQPSASATLLYLFQHAKPMVQQQMLSTLSDPHFPALVAEMEQILSQHMWLFFPATADDE